MDERLCEANKKYLLDKINALTLTVDKQTVQIAENRLMIAGQAKDTLHLQQAIATLQKSIESLIAVIEGMKYKPVKNYEKAVWIIITAIIMFALGRLGIS